MKGPKMVAVGAIEQTNPNHLLATTIFPPNK